MSINVGKTDVVDVSNVCPYVADEGKNLLDFRLAAMKSRNSGAIGVDRFFFTYFPFSIKSLNGENIALN